jgi:hypothetical protein
MKMKVELADLKQVKAENERLRKGMGLRNKLNGAELQPNRGLGSASPKSQNPISPRLTNPKNPDWNNLGGGN